MANAYSRLKNSNVFVGGLTLNEQAASPLAEGESGLYVDSNGVPHFMSAGIEGGMLAQRGIIPAARLNFATNPTADDTVTIGSHVFKFVAALGAADTFTQVKILGSAALTLAAFLDAINGVTNADVVEGSTPFALSVVADAVTATKLRLRKADEQGGTAIAGTVSTTALSETLTAAADIWSAANLNVSGKAASAYQVTAGAVTITAAMVTNASFQIELPFTPTAFVHMCSSSTGVQRAITDAITISGNAINVALAGGASPAIQAGDLFRFVAYE